MKKPPAAAVDKLWEQVESSTKKRTDSGRNPKRLRDQDLRQEEISPRENKF